MVEADIESSILPPITAETANANNPFLSLELLEMMKRIVDDLSDSDQSYDEDFVRYPNDSSDNQGLPEAQALDGQPEAVIDVDIDVDIIPATDYRDLGHGHRSVIDKILSEVGFDDQAQVELCAGSSLGSSH